MSIKKHIPNTITCCNLISGCLHTIEVTMKDVRIRISNDVDPQLLARALHLIRETLC
jgi:hypothetical protein